MRSLFFFLLLTAATAVAWSGGSVHGMAAWSPVQQNDVKVQIDDDLLSFAEGQPYLDDQQRLFVPVRTVAEAMGYEVGWERAEGEYIVSLVKDEQVLQLVTNADYAYLNGTELAILSPAVLEDGRMYAPIRFLAETLGILLQWDERNRIVILSLNGQYRAPAWYAPQYEVLEVSATAYSASPAENGVWGAVDYFGNALELGTIAVDPSVIPLGSKVYIEGYDFDHLPEGGLMGTASDTGGAVKGERIDIFIPASPDQVRQFGKQNVKVYILD